MSHRGINHTNLQQLQPLQCARSFQWHNETQPWGDVIGLICILDQKHPNIWQHYQFL